MEWDGSEGRCCHSHGLSYPQGAALSVGLPESPASSAKGVLRL